MVTQEEVREAFRIVIPLTLFVGIVIGVAFTALAYIVIPSLAHLLVIVMLVASVTAIVKDYGKLVGWFE